MRDTEQVDERPEAVQYSFWRVGKSIINEGIFKVEQQATQRPHGRNQYFMTGLA
jgi:hypothetical protein